MCYFFTSSIVSFMSKFAYFIIVHSQMTHNFKKDSLRYLQIYYVYLLCCELIKCYSCVCVYVYVCLSSCLSVCLCLSACSHGRLYIYSRNPCKLGALNSNITYIHKEYLRWVFHWRWCDQGQDY